MKKISLLITLCSLWNLVIAQSAKEQLALANSADLITKDFFEEISFEDRFGYIIIPVKIGAKTYEYIFDTGGYNTLTSEIMNSNEIEKRFEVEIGSANKIKSTIGAAKIPGLSIGGVAFGNIGAFNFDFEESPQIKCYTNGGLLGKGVIKEAVWQINYEERKIVITDDLQKLQHLDNAIRIKVKLDKTFNPFIKAKVNGATIKFLLDFGFGGFISFTEDTGKNLASENPIVVSGEGSIGANGIDFENTYITPLQNFKLGKAEIKKPIAYYSKNNNYNLIGTDIVKYYIVTLNFKESELYLTPIADATREVEIKQSFGFDLNREGEKVYVSRIFEGLAAEKAGLQLNDVVLEMNGMILNEIPYCEFYSIVKKELDSKKSIQLKIKRKGENQLVEIFKTNLIGK